MDGNRVDLGNVKGDTGLTGVGISNIVELGYDNINSLRNFRIIFTDNSTFEYSLFDNTSIRRANEMSVGNPSSDMMDVPTLYLLKNTLLSYPKNTDVYRKENTYSRSEINEMIATAISEMELVEIIEDLEELEEDEIKTGRLYMVTKTQDSDDALNNTFDLYIYNDGNWIQLDNLSFSLSDYLTSSQVNSLLANKQDKSNISTNIGSDSSSNTKYPSVSATKTYVDTKVSSELNDYYTKSEIDERIDDFQEFIHS